MHKNQRNPIRRRRLQRNDPRLVQILPAVPQRPQPRHPQLLPAMLHFMDQVLPNRTVIRRQYLLPSTQPHRRSIRRPRHPQHLSTTSPNRRLHRHRHRKNITRIRQKRMLLPPLRRPLPPRHHRYPRPRMLHRRICRFPPSATGINRSNLNPAGAATRIFRSPTTTSVPSAQSRGNAPLSTTAPTVAATTRLYAATSPSPRSPPATTLSTRGIGSRPALSFVPEGVAHDPIRAARPTSSSRSRFIGSHTASRPLSVRI